MERFDEIERMINDAPDETISEETQEEIVQRALRITEVRRQEEPQKLKRPDGPLTKHARKRRLPIVSLQSVMQGVLIFFVVAMLLMIVSTRDQIAHAVTAGENRIMQEVADLEQLIRDLRTYEIQPASISVTPDGRVANLLDYRQQIMHTWGPTAAEYAIRAGALIERPTELGGGTVALLGFNQNAVELYPRELVAFDANNYEQVLWSRSVLDDELPGNLPEREGYKWMGTQFGVKTFEVFDVFSESPGKEIVAVFTHDPSSICTVRIYDLAGTLLWQCWHDGPVTDIHYLTESREIICVGWNSEVTVKHRGIEGSDAFHARVLFGLTPEFKATDPVWVNTIDHVGGIEPAMYKCLFDVPTLNFVTDVSVTFPHPEYNRDAFFKIEFGVATRLGRGSFSMTMDAQGHETDRPRTPDDRYSEALRDYSNTPSPDGLRWDDLPPILDWSVIEWLPGTRRDRSTTASPDRERQFIPGVTGFD